MFCYWARRIAFIVGIRGVLSIGVSVRTDHIDARQKVPLSFHFNATRTNFPLQPRRTILQDRAIRLLVLVN